MIAVAAICLLLLVFVLWPDHRQAGAPAASDTSSSAPADSRPAPDLDNPSSITVVVNKLRPLPDGYAPTDLVVPNVPLRLSGDTSEMHMRQEAAAALENLVADAKAAGLNLLLLSGYRSQATQYSVYNRYVAEKGQALADTDSARPGFSEHQTGLAVDLGRADGQCQLEACFGETAEGTWLAENMARYGFILRYLPGRDSVTGYVYEPWHLRYIGKDLAEKVMTSGQTLEEYFGLPPAPTYAAN